MVYSTECAKWKAYQFSDPFAAGSFFVCNKISKTFCRPDCDARARTNLKLEIKFVDGCQEAMDLGFHPCQSCEPINLPPIDVSLLFNCVSSINRQIGFLPPLLDENEEKNNHKIKENIIESKKTNEEQILRAFNNGGLNRRASVPAINYDGKFSKDFENTSLSKNDSDHYRLVDLACRHLALAAAMNIFQPQAIQKLEASDEGNSPSSGKKRRRRGGVLGFKELAAKSKLSAWHFHRVFKSVTGLTPKTYGDKCWEFVKNFKDSGENTSFQANTTNYYQTPISSNSSSPNLESPVKKQHISPSPIESQSSMQQSLQPPIQQQPSQMVSPQYSVPQSNFDFNMPVIDYTQDLSNHSRAFSAPDLTFFNMKPNTLFEHAKTHHQPMGGQLASQNTSPNATSPLFQQNTFEMPSLEHDQDYLNAYDDVKMPLLMSDEVAEEIFNNNSSNSQIKLEDYGLFNLSPELLSSNYINL